jgi:hypothetical protein
MTVCTAQLLGEMEAQGISKESIFIELTAQNRGGLKIHRYQRTKGYIKPTDIRMTGAAVGFER